MSRQIFKLGVSLAAAAVTATALAGCANTIKEAAADSLDTRSVLVQEENEPVEHIPLINTGSILFPWYQLSAEGVEEERALFITGETDIADEEITIGERIANIRSGPGESFPIEDVLLPGETVTVDSNTGHWYRLADGRGYVSEQDFARPKTDGITWRTSVANSGGIPELDECTGGLTDYTTMSDAVGVPVYAIHSHCGGDRVLHLELGDIVRIGIQDYKVSTIETFPLLGSMEIVDEMNEAAYIQTADLVNGTNHVVGLQPTEVG